MALQAVRGTVVDAVSAGITPASFVSSIVDLLDLPITPVHDVDVYQVSYQTITPDGAPTMATGALMLPNGVTQAVPLLSHQHGTVILTNEVASQGQGEYLLGLVWASIGYAAAMPDYLGMGGGSGLHPYVHARSEATAVVDLLRASRTICAQANVMLNGQVFLIGYSQGGQATMAAHKEIESCCTGEFTITASAPMAGPHDMSGTMADMLASDQPYGSPFYLPYTLFAYNSVYRLYDSLTNVLRVPYATTLPPLFDGQHSESQINAVMPSVPSQILRPEYLEGFRNDPNHPFRVVLRRNDLYNWTPHAPMHLYHCHGDTTVPFVNSQIAYDHFQTNGAPQVMLIDPYMQGTHSTCVTNAFVAAKEWFDTLKN